MIRSLFLPIIAALTPWFSALAEEKFDPQADFEAFWSLFDERYALHEVKGVDWAAAGHVYRPKVTHRTTRSELFSIFEEATNLLNDVHVTVRDEKDGRFARSGGRSLGIGEFDTGVFSLDLIADHYAAEGLALRAGGTMRYGWLDAGLAYMHLSAFRYPTTTKTAMDEVIKSFSQARTVIIDIRQNGGGSDAVARLIASYFADKRRLVMTAADWRPEQRSLGEAQQWFVEPQPSTFTGRIVILTNDRTISAAENFALMMREFPHVTLLGQTTAGAMADTVPMSIGNGWTFGVPINVLRDADGQSWEGIGVAPNLWIANRPLDIEAGKDKVLDLAIAFAGAPPAAD